MNDTTRLEPLLPARARQLLELMQRSSRDHDTALALEDGGRVIGLVDASDESEEHLLGDLDVHA